MSAPEVHFELFIRRNATADWTLELATEVRTQALETAAVMIAEKCAVAVRVSKETRDPASGEYRSLILLTQGEARAQAKPKTAVEGAAPPCTGPHDLYTPHAREVVGRLLDPWLRRKLATAFELLHRGDLAEQLEASGMELQHAIQKIAVAEAQAGAATTHEVIRAYQKLTDRAVERVIRDGRRGAFPVLAKTEAFADVAERVAGTAEAQYLLGGAVAQHLAAARTWNAKIELILDLADAAPTAPPARALAFAVLAQPLGEIVSLRLGLGEVAGVEPDLGASLALFTRLVAATEIAALSRIEPALERQFPPLTPGIDRLAEWLRHRAFEPVRDALARRIVAELNGPRRLRPSDPQGEIAILRALAMALTACAGRMISPDVVQDAFTARSTALVGPHFVQAYLATAHGGALAEVWALTRLSENVVGAANKRAALKWMIDAIASPRLEREMRTGGDGPPTSPGSSPASSLAALAQLQQAMGRIGLAEPDRLKVADQIGELGGLVEADAKLLAALARSQVPPARRVAALLQFASGERAPLGPVSLRARAELQKMMRTPEVRADLAGAPELMDRLKDTMQAA